MEIEANERDFEVLMINAFGYSMPRFMTTAFEPTEAIILSNLKYLHTWVLVQFLQDIDWERNAYEVSKDGRIFADDNPSCRDDFYDKIKTEIKRREGARGEQGKGYERAEANEPL